MTRLIRPPRGVFFVVGNGQGNAEIVSVVGNGEYFDFNFLLDDVFEYALESKNLEVAETGVGQIVATAPNKGLFSRTVILSTDGAGQALNLQVGETYTLLLKTADASALTVDPLSGLVTNPEAVNRTVIALDFDQLKTQAIPTLADVYFFVAYGVVPGDGRGGLFEWVPGSVAAFNNIAVDLDVNVIKSDNSVNGRYIRRATGWIPEQTAAGARPTGMVARDSTTKGMVSYHPISGERKIPEVYRNYSQGEWPTLAALLAEPSTYVNNTGGTSQTWQNGDIVVVLGYAGEGDALRPLRLTWITNDVEVSATVLGVNKWRPNDIAGGNPGRWSIVQPDQQDVFVDADATPDVSASDVFQVAANPPAGGYTAFDQMRDGRFAIVRPGAKAAKFVHSANFKMPGGRDHWLLPGDPPLMFYRNNTITEVINGKARPYMTTHVGDGTATVVINRYIDPTAYLIYVDGAPIYPSQITSVTPDTPGANQTSIVFSFNITAQQTVAVFG